MIKIYQWSENSMMMVRRTKHGEEQNKVREVNEDKLKDGNKSNMKLEGTGFPAIVDEENRILTSKNFKI